MESPSSFPWTVIITETSVSTVFQYATTFTVTTTVTMYPGAAVGGVIGPSGKIAILGAHVDVLGLVVTIVLIVAVITGPAASKKRDN